MQIKFYDDFIIFKVVEMLVWILIKTRFFMTLIQFLQFMTLLRYLDLKSLKINSR